MAQMENVVSAQARPETYYTTSHRRLPGMLSLAVFWAVADVQPSYLLGSLRLPPPLQTPRISPREQSEQKDGKCHSWPRRSIAIGFRWNASGRDDACKRFYPL